MRSLLLAGLLVAATTLACSDGEGAALLPAEHDAASTDSAPDSAKDAGDAPDARAQDAGADAADAAPPPPPDIDSIPWATGTNVGYGVASKDTQNPAGDSMFVAYAGYNVSLDGAKAWTTALYRAWLQAHGVRYVWAVQGPKYADYAGLEIGNSKIAASILPHVSPQTKFVLVAGHSSGSFVAHELLNQLANGADPLSLTKGKVVYFNLDGGMQGASAATGLPSATVARLRKAYFVAPHASNTNTYGFNLSSMQTLGNQYGGFFEVDGNNTGCNAGATACLHISLVISKPHNPATADPVLDYEDFAGRPVTTAYLIAKAAEAGL